MNNIDITTPQGLAEYLKNQPEPAADRRERMRVLLMKLPNAARAVYNRDDIQDPSTPVWKVINTVLYNFDPNNRTRVAQALGLDYDEFIALLIGFVLGRERHFWGVYDE